MASIPCVLIVLLICWTQDHMDFKPTSSSTSVSTSSTPKTTTDTPSNSGSSGVRGETPPVFSSVGQNATLPCGNVVQPDCSNTTWIYSGGGDTVELVTLGKVKNCTDPHNSDECKIAKRMSLHSGCSLKITEVTTDDAGTYICQQYEGEGKSQIGEGAPVDLSILSVSTSPKVTEMEAESHVTLHCVLHTYDHCGGSVKDKGVHLSWVNKTDSELKNTTKRQIRTTSLCNITLTEELRDPYSNTANWKWRCQLTAGQDKVFANYSIKNKDFKPTSSSTSVSTSSTPKTTTDTPSNSGSSGAQPTFPSSTQVSDNKPTVSKSSTPKTTTSITVSTDSDPSVVPLIAGVGVPLGLLAAALIIVVMHKRRTNAGGDTQHTAIQKDEEADLHYAALQHLNPTQDGLSAKRSEDTVTYSSIMQLSGGEDQNTSRPAGGPADPNAVYATVQKSDKTQD
ncbi:uncharacterized protein LOC143136320 [Alosa pseudoharengus]|uniref:uncharacterized protein LOC143136320 n=1 Tax=Alosa pseudoharengus TaxID=34774 RepID=UPI003F890F21